jgi:hypothetical protein
MANANWSNPTLTSTYTNFVSEVKNRDEDLALQFDGTTSTNLPTNAIRWDSSAGRWKKWNGSSWAELTSTYALTALSTTGNANIGGTLGVTGAATLSSTLGVTGAITGSSTVSGTALIPTAATVPTNGVYLPAANTVAVATNSTGRLFVDASGRVGIGTASNSSYKLAVQSDSADTTFSTPYLNYGTVLRNDNQTNNNYSAFSFNTLNSTGADTTVASIGAQCTSHTAGAVNGTLAFFTTGASTLVERMRLTSDGRLGVGTSSPGYLLDVAGTVNVVNGSNGRINIGATNNYLYGDSSGNVIIGTSGSDKVQITSAGRVGIGTASPQARLVASNSGAEGVEFLPGSASNVNISQHYNRSGSAWCENRSDAALHSWYIQGSERAKIDASGRLLVGTSTARSNVYGSFTPSLQLEGGSVNGQDMLLIARNQNDIYGPHLILAKSRGTANTIVASGDLLGTVSMVGNDGSSFIQAARIEVFVDGTPGANDMPGRLVFSTTADGASSPTERLRISSNGAISSVIPGGSTLYPNFGARAWVNFNGTGTVAIRASGNVSSITDNGTGNYTLNFTSALPDANYNFVFGTNDADRACESLTMAAGSFQLGVWTIESNVRADLSVISVAIFR